MKISKTMSKINIFIAVVILGLVTGILFNQIIQTNLEKSIKQQLSKIEVNTKKETKNTMYLNFDNSKVKCTGFFKYECSINNNALTFQNNILHGDFARWNMKIDNISYSKLSIMQKGLLNDIGLEISNLSPTKKAAIIFDSKMYKYVFPMNIGFHINSLSTQTKKENNVTIAKRNIDLKNLYLDVPAFKINYDLDFSIKDAPSGFFVYLDKKGNIITDKKALQQAKFKSSVRVDATSKIVFHKIDFKLQNKQISKFLYTWYKNVGSKNSFLSLNKKFFYMNDYKMLSFTEFNQQIKKIFKEAIKDVPSKDPNFKWFKSYLSALNELYFNKIKTVEIQAINKGNIPFQASYVISRLYPGITSQISFLGKYYNITIKKEK